MGAIEYGFSRLSTFGGLAALVVAGALITWLVGLLIILKGSKPEERSEIIRAYALCNPLVYLRRSGSGGGAMDPQDADGSGGGAEVYHQGNARRKILPASRVHNCQDCVPSDIYGA